MKIFNLMKIIMRKSNIEDLDNIYNLHNLCFTFNDRWYKNAICQYIDDSIVIVTEDNEIIGVLLQGNFNPILNDEELVVPNIDNKSDLVVPNIDKDFVVPNIDDEVFGIVMICIHPDYRNKGLASKLINTHIKINNEKKLYLCTRITNTNAILCYKKNGYELIGNIKNKYYLPVEDACFMIYKKMKI